MDEHLKELLGSLATRTRKGRWGIGTAEVYVSAMLGCFKGGACPTELFDGTTPCQWEKALKEAAGKLVYCDRHMTVSRKSIDTSSAVPKGFVMTFDHVITSTRKDRDGDILESTGAVLDPNMPLLWQHLPPSPIGRFIATTRQTEKLVAGKSGIADTALGRDAAALVEVDALRISHGFEPLEFEPLKGDKDGGWHIKRFEILEVSLVSVPSNTDAVIRAYSKNKLHAPAVRAWAKAQHDQRPVMVPGVTLEKVEPRSGDVHLTVNISDRPHEGAKAGRVVAGRNVSRLSDASDQLDMALEHSAGALQQTKTAAEHTAGASEQVNGAMQHSALALDHMKVAMEHAASASEQAKGTDHNALALDHIKVAMEHNAGAIDQMKTAAGRSADAVDQINGAAKHSSEAYGAIESAHDLVKTVLRENDAPQDDAGDSQEGADDAGEMAGGMGGAMPEKTMGAPKNFGDALAKLLAAADQTANPAAALRKAASKLNALVALEAQAQDAQADEEDAAWTEVLEQLGIA